MKEGKKNSLVATYIGPAQKGERIVFTIAQPIEVEYIHLVISHTVAQALGIRGFDINEDEALKSKICDTLS